MTALRARAVRRVAFGLCLLVLVGQASGQVQVGTNVVVALTTNQTLYATGEVFELGRTLDLVRPSAQAQGDLYVRMQDPAGQFMYLGGEPERFVESAAVGAGMVLSASSPAFRSTPPWPLDVVRGLSGRVTVRRTVLAGPIPDGLRPGTYTFDAALVRPGGDPRDPSAVITTSIPISVNVGTPSRVGNSAIRVTSTVVGAATNPRTNTVALARDPGILSLVNLATERVVFSTPLLEPQEATLGAGLTWAGSLGAVAVNPETNVAVVTNAQPIYAGLPSFSPSVWLVRLSDGQIIARLPLDLSPAIADPTRSSPGRCYFAFTAGPQRILAVRPVAVNSRTNTAVVSSVTQAQPDASTLYFIDLTQARILRTFPVGFRVNSIAIDEVRNRLIGIGRETLFVLDLGNLALRPVPFPAGLGRFCGASRTLAIIPETGEVVVTGATLQSDNSTLGAVTVIDVDRGQVTAPVVELPRTVGAQDPVLVAGTRQALVTGPAAGLSRLVLVSLDRVLEVGSFETSVPLATGAVSPQSDAVLLFGDADNLLVIRPGGLPLARPTGGLRVRVRNAATGAPVEGSHVVVEGTGFASVTTQGFPIDFQGVSPGPQRVTVSAAGFDPRAVEVTVEPGRSPEQQELIVSLQPGGAVSPLRGRILVEGGASMTSQATGRARGGPMRQVLVGQPGVTIRIPGTNFQVVSGADGAFRVEQAPVGTFIVSAAASGFLATQEIVPIRRETDNQLIFTLLRTLGS